MNYEEYKKIIIRMIENSNCLEWIKAVYTFAKHYPNTKEGKE